MLADRAGSNAFIAGKSKDSSNKDDVYAHTLGYFITQLIKRENAETSQTTNATSIAPSPITITKSKIVVQTLIGVGGSFPKKLTTS